MYNCICPQRYSTRTIICHLIQKRYFSYRFLAASSLILNFRRLHSNCLITRRKTAFLAPKIFMKHNNLAAVVNNGLRTEVYMGRSRSRSRHIYSMPNKSSHPTAYVTYSHLSGLFYQGGIVGTVVGHGTSPI